MKALLLVVLVIVVVGGGLKMAGIRLPLLDFPLSQIGADSGPMMPDVQIEAPGFRDISDP